MAAHRRSDETRDGLYAVGLRKRAFAIKVRLSAILTLVATTDETSPILAPTKRAPWHRCGHGGLLGTEDRPIREICSFRLAFADDCPL